MADDSAGKELLTLLYRWLSGEFGDPLGGPEQWRPVDWRSLAANGTDRQKDRELAVALQPDLVRTLLAFLATNPETHVAGVERPDASYRRDVTCPESTTGSKRHVVKTVLASHLAQRSRCYVEGLPPASLPRPGAGQCAWRDCDSGPAASLVPHGVPVRQMHKERRLLFLIRLVESPPDKVLGFGKCRVGCTAEAVELHQEIEHSVLVVGHHGADQLHLDLVLLPADHVDANQYCSYVCSPPWAGLPMSCWPTGSTTKSMTSNGTCPTRTGQSSGTSTTSLGQSRP